MKINEIIYNIDKNYLFVPSFQREYVWKREQAKLLIQSLIKDYPTGTLLTWETTNPPELKGQYTYESSKGKIKLILDGQQRITTLYMLITGNIPPYYKQNDILQDIRELYVHIQTLELEYYKKMKMQNDPHWVKLTSIFKKDIRRKDIIDEIIFKQGQEIERHVENIIEDNLEKLQQIPYKELLEQIVPSQASTKEAIDIFYIVNASGVSLTDAELALAQISGYWPQAREKFKSKLEKMKEHGWVLKLDFIVYVLLAVLHRMGSKMEKLHSDDNRELIIKAWDLLDKQILDYTFNILQSHAYVDHTDEINSVYALIPIITYIYLKDDHKLNEEEIAKIVKWFYYSQIRNRYISQLPQKLDRDLKILEKSSSPFDDLLQVIEKERALEISPSDFVGRDIRHPLFGLMRWYFKSLGAVCLGTGNKIRKNMGAKYKLERDHIFPYAKLRDSEYYDMGDRIHYALAQEMTNRAILTSTENISKSAKDTYRYLKKVQERFPSALELQCIPEDENLWKIEKYEDFLKSRRELLAGKLNEYLSTLSILPTNHYKIEISIEDLIEDGEKDFLEFKETLRWDKYELKINKELEFAILKTIAAFSNSEGGTLLIGVADNSSISGLDDDFNTLSKSNRDGFELHTRQLIKNSFGELFLINFIKISFPEVNEVEICRIDIQSGKDPLYLSKKNKSGKLERKFYVRSGNASPEMALDDAVNYIRERFK